MSLQNSLQSAKVFGLAAVVADSAIAISFRFIDTG